MFLFARARIGALMLAFLAAPVLAVAGVDVPAPSAKNYPGEIVLEVDATDLERKIFTVRETIPVKPGPLVLLYPQWVPGSHAPIGNIVQFTGLRLQAGSQELRWKRDPVNMYAFHVEIPSGVRSIEARFEFLSPLQSSQGRVVMTQEMLHLQFDRVLLYPAGVQADGIRVAATVKLPEGWRYASALDGGADSAGAIRFPAVSLTKLVDSPLMAGRHFKQIAMADSPAVRMNLFAEREDGLAVPEKAQEAHRALVVQAYKLFGTPPYEHFDFLMAMGDGIGGIGREHMQSTEITVPANFFKELDKGSTREMVVPHEFAHAWVGKYRRPADLLTANFNTPMQNSLLWVYEGQAQYFGIVLETRAKLRSQEATRDGLATQYASTENRRGREWRDLQDTVNDDIMGLRSVPRGWNNWQRTGGDYYTEGALIWLGVDARIRSLTGEKRSLDDFAHAFYSATKATIGQPVAYRFDDIVAALNRVAPYDWAAYLRERVEGRGDKVVRDDLGLAGWQLVYRSKPNDQAAKVAKDSGQCDAFYSLGLNVGKDEKISNVQWNSLAFKAGIVPGATVLAVNGKVYKCSGLTDALGASEKAGTTIELILRQDRDVKVIRLPYSGGARYPHLERIVGTPDRLSAILEAR